MSILLLLASLAVAVAWVPILARFFYSWQDRHNPISLALCGIILLVIYANINVLSIYLFKSNVRWTAYAILTFSAAACLNFYLCTYWADKKFKDSRQV